MELSIFMLWLVCMCLAFITLLYGSVGQAGHR